MKRSIAALVAALCAGAMNAGLSDAGAAPSIRRAAAGALSCDVAAGIALIVAERKPMTCLFIPLQPGPQEVYVGTVSKFSFAGETSAGGQMVWHVQAPTPRRFGALTGTYASGRAAIGGEAERSVLIGGSDRGIALQPVANQSQTDVNFASGVAALELRPAR